MPPLVLVAPVGGLPLGRRQLSVKSVFGVPTGHPPIGGPYLVRNALTGKYYAFNLTAWFEFGRDFVPVLTYGASVLTGGTSYAMQDRDDPTFAAGKAVDGSVGTLWASQNSTVPQWWAYDLGAGHSAIVQRVGWASGSGRSEFIGAFTVGGSADGVTWDPVLYTGTAVNTVDWQFFTFTNGAAYRFYRLMVTSVLSGDLVQLGEIGMYEVT